MHLTPHSCRLALATLLAGLCNMSAAQGTDPALEALKRSQFCTRAAKDFMSRPQWKPENQISDQLDYTSHYNAVLNKCLVQVRRIHFYPAKGERIEMTHVYDALDGKNLGGKVISSELGTREANVTGIVVVRDSKFVRDPKEAAATLDWLDHLMIN